MVIEFIQATQTVRALYNQENLARHLPNQKTRVYGFGEQMYKKFPKLNGFWKAQRGKIIFKNKHCSFGKREI